jgi:hypothetical protein
MTADEIVNFIMAHTFPDVSALKMLTLCIYTYIYI